MRQRGGALATRLAESVSGGEETQPLSRDFCYPILGPILPPSPQLKPYVATSAPKPGTASFGPVPEVPKKATLLA